MSDRDTPTDADAAPARAHNRATDLDSIVVDPVDVLEAMRLNARDVNERRRHVLRVTPPLKGERHATPHVSEDGTRYPPDMSPRPIHLNVRELVDDSSDATEPPTVRESAARFREEFDIDPEADVTEHDQWAEWWDADLGVWEVEVWRNLTDSLDIAPADPDADAETVTVPIDYADTPEGDR